MLIVICWCIVVKAGGMRVTQNKPPRDEVVAKDGGASAEESTEEQQVATKEKPSPVVVAGFETQVCEFI